MSRVRIVTIAQSVRAPVLYERDACVVGLSSAVGKNVSFCIRNSRFLRMALESANTNKFNRDIHLAFTLF